MAVIHLLKETLVQDAGDGDHADGGGLSLRIDGANAKWVFRYTAPSGKRRAMALGTAVRSGTRRQIQASMESARELAQEARGLLRRGLDPIELRNATKAEARQKEAAQRAEKRR
ncbi:MAG: DUF4102 domain-containing protein [Burkholderiales bacterium]|nr:MAG: DUF4102 domain-containing protein [Burkholderiales bacterium]